MDGDVRYMVGIAVWGRMYANREFGGEPGSLLLYIITASKLVLELRNATFKSFTFSRSQKEHQDTHPKVLPQFVRSDAVIIRQLHDKVSVLWSITNHGLAPLSVIRSVGNKRNLTECFDFHSQTKTPPL